MFYTRCYVALIIMKTIVWFMMAKGDEAEKVIFQGSPSYNEIEEYFEEKCGGVYKWWI